MRYPHLKIKLSSILFSLALLGCSLPIIATESNQEITTSTLPQRGEVMESVIARLGSPRVKHPPVGDPPIERWVYDTFTIYFEYNRVIHTVDNQRKIPSR